MVQKTRKKTRLEYREFYQTRTRGSNCQEYGCYLDCADNGKGLDITTGIPLKTFHEWMNS